ncbi:MAG: PIN domain-containing protein [Blastocatellia bacterium]|nr:PIN domain-containing protein [Blastocatellia bacterium]
MTATKIYLDACCIQRPLDDQRQDRIRLEAEATILIISKVEKGLLVWSSSEIIDYELSLTPDLDRAKKALLIAANASEKIILGETEIVRGSALERLGFSGYDALHIACAESGRCDFFLTTDDKLLKRAQKYAADIEVQVTNPLTWLQEVISI